MSKSSKDDALKRTTTLHPKIAVEDLGDPDNGRLLTKQQTEFVEQYLRENPGPQKISRKKVLTLKNPLPNVPPTMQLPYSVIVFDNGEAKALYKGKGGKALGEGSYGRVKLSQNIRTGAWDPIKIIPFNKETQSEEKHEKAFRNEASLEQDIGSNLGDLLREREVGSANYAEVAKKGYIATRLHSGSELFEQIHLGLIKTFEESLYIAIKVTEDLKKRFHDRNIIHCDIKPENIIYDRKTKNLALIDVGAAQNLEKFIKTSGRTDEKMKADDDNMQVTDILKGTEEFVSPEILASLQYSRKSDVYALGVMFEDDLALLTFQKDKSETQTMLQKLISDMKKSDFRSRPNVGEVLKRLTDIKFKAEETAKAAAEKAKSATTHPPVPPRTPELKKLEAEIKKRQESGPPPLPSPIFAPKLAKEKEAKTRKVESVLFKFAQPDKPPSPLSPPAAIREKKEEAAPTPKSAMAIWKEREAAAKREADAKNKHPKGNSPKRPN